VHAVIDHVILNIRDYRQSKRFYDGALSPLGLTPIMAFEQMCGYGVDGKPWLWIAQRGEPSAGTHVALSAPDRATVDAFYEAALESGGRDNGPPGLRPHYHETYYGAFALDPDGNNIEAVCHRPE
jgi:catechol 2,3-dioxygenase-like lactoylglutathione lyase family enzyme